MDDAAQDNEAPFETVAFLDHFDHLPDFRRRGKVTFSLGEVLLPAVLAGAELFAEIASLGEKKLDIPRRCRPGLRMG